jgi:hypothetical protein
VISADTGAATPVIPARAVDALSAFERALRDSSRVDLSWIGRPLREHGWELAPDVLRLLTALVAHVRPRHVIEFGSGLSTLVLARAAAALEDSVVSSIEHDPRFARASAEALVDAEGGSRVSLQCAPLVARVWAGALHPTYLLNASALASRRPSEIVLIDGPPAVLGGRAGTLYQALEYAQCGSIVLVDDAARDEESTALTAWQERLGGAVRVMRPEGFARGLAAVVLLAPNVAKIRMSESGRP